MGLLNYLLVSQIRTQINPEKLSDLPKVIELIPIRLEPRLLGSELGLPLHFLVILIGAGVSKLFCKGPENEC